MPTKKYFIAIILPPPYFEQVEEIKQELLTRFGLKGALRSPSHLTLHRPFEWEEKKEEQLIERLQRFQQSSPFELNFADFGFFEPRVIYAALQAQPRLFDLHHALTQFAKRELRLFNEAEDLRGFHPHVTIAFRDLKKPLFYSLREEFEGRKLSGCFEYSGFSLLKLEKTWQVLRDFKAGNTP